jgi:hypothetical protein
MRGTRERFAVVEFPPLDASGPVPIQLGGGSAPALNVEMEQSTGQP